MKIHFIAIGGAVMHNLAIALHKKGYKVTGSDDEIFEPSRSRLNKHDLLPNEIGWNKNNIKNNLDAVITGMHAKDDNIEIKEAKAKGIRIYSFPEYLYEQSKNKKRIVIGGSHGKTTTTSMIMHVMKDNNLDFDYMVGANIEGFDTMVKITDAPVAVFEGDEYLSSPLDKRPKFHLYKPHIGVVTGIAWDHVNVFPTFGNYVLQFEKFIELICENGTLIYCNLDDKTKEIAEKSQNNIKKIGYKTHNHRIENGKTYLTSNNKKYKLEVFGKHNLQNISAAYYVCKECGISDESFYKSISNFKGAGKRLQKLGENKNTTVFLDFAHSPSKLKATLNAVKEQFKERELIACMELHTFSSLKKEYLNEYKDTMDKADRAIVFFNPEVLKHKRLDSISPAYVKAAFNKKNLIVFTNKNDLLKELNKIYWQNKNLLLMSSGNFSGVDFKRLTKNIL